MRKGRARQIGPNEVGFAVCRFPSGRLVAGPQAEGTPTEVNIPVRCPAGSAVHALYHSHPNEGGGYPYPSSTDHASARRVGARAVCVETVAEGVHCWVPRGPRLPDASRALSMKSER